MAKVDLLSKDELEKIVQSSRTLQEVLRKIGYSSASGANTDHFTKGVSTGIKRTEENVFCEDSTATQKTLREWYIKGSYTEYKCSICGQEPFWNGKPLSLILDHIDGNNTNNVLSNLRWVCPNCDRQLDTFGSKNKRIFGSVDN